MHKWIIISVGQAEDKKKLFGLHRIVKGAIMLTRTEKITLRLPWRFLGAPGLLVSANSFPSRSEAMSTAVRDLVHLRSRPVTRKAKKGRESHRNVANLRMIRTHFGLSGI